MTPHRARRPGRVATLALLVGAGITLAGCYYVVPASPVPARPPYAAPAPPPGAVLVPGQWVWNGAAWVWRRPYWAYPAPAPPPIAAPPALTPPGPPPAPRS
jgi:hypothetical protein